MNSHGLSKTIQLGPNSIENNAEKAVGIPTSIHKRLILSWRSTCTSAQEYIAWKSHARSNGQVSFACRNRDPLAFVTLRDST